MQIFCYNIKVQSKEQTNCLIQQSVEEYFKGKNISFEKINILRTEKGKPYIENADIHIGVTHTEKLVMIGVCKTPFGIDMEEEDRKILRKNQIINRFFSDKEKEVILSKSEGLQDKEFLKLWVKKEAFLKYTGQGIEGISEADTFCIKGHFTKVNYPGITAFIYSPENIEYKIKKGEVSYDI